MQHHQQQFDALQTQALDLQAAAIAIVRRLDNGDTIKREDWELRELRQAIDAIPHPLTHERCAIHQQQRPNRATTRREARPALDCQQAS